MRLVLQLRGTLHCNARDTRDHIDLPREGRRHEEGSKDAHRADQHEPNLQA